MSDIAGYCPACGGSSLFVAEGGYITCSRADCPEPTAVADILDDRETEHLVDLTEDNFTVRHPLRERLRDELLRCDLHHYLTSLSGPPRAPGCYRAKRLDGTWHFIAARKEASR